MAELVDAPGLSPDDGYIVRVRVSYRPPNLSVCACNGRTGSIPVRGTNLTKFLRVIMYRVYYQNRWIENVPVTEALVYKEEGHVVQRMDLPYTTPPNTTPVTVVLDNRQVVDDSDEKSVYHLKQYGTVSEEQMKRYIATGDISFKP